MENDRIISRASIEGRNTRTDNVIIIDNVVYDVTAFLDDHPGGPEILLDNGGKDASACFRDVGHSDIALDWRKEFRIGVVPEEERREEMRPIEYAVGPDESTFDAMIRAITPPVVLGLVAIFVYKYFIGDF